MSSDGNSVVGKKWNQNQSDLTTPLTVNYGHKLQPDTEREVEDYFLRDNHNDYRYH